MEEGEGKPLPFDLKRQLGEWPGEEDWLEAGCGLCFPSCVLCCAFLSSLFRQGFELAAG